MEKIQSAIAKARAARTDLGGRPPKQAPLVATRPNGRPAPTAEASSAAWESLTTVPLNERHLAAHRIAAYVGGPGSIELDMLRTRVLQQIEPQGWRRIAITSPDPACGKTMVATNLAFSLARQEGQKVLVIELDLRRPSLAKVLGVKPATGIAALLAGEAKIEDCALRLGRNLAVLPATGPSRNPAELLRSPSALSVLADLEARLAPTIILFDLPPMLVNDDTMSFVGRADCAILVAAAESSTIKQIDTCERDLAAQTNVLGVVLNKCRYMDGNETYYGYE